MPPRTNTTARLPASPGLLRPEEFSRHVRFAEVAPTGAAAAWVERLWSTNWALPDETSQTTQLIPHPSVSLTVERGGLARGGVRGDGVRLTGVVTGRFDVTLTGTGGTVGVKFRPGGFTAWSGVGSDRLTDRVLPAAELLPGTTTLSRLELDAEASAAALCGYLEGHAESAEPIPAALRTVLATALAVDVTRVDDLAERCDSSVRALQRLVRHYVGVSPKWLIRRHRMHDAVKALDAGTTETIAALAARLGWYDQSQFARDFTALVGVPPASYRNRSRAAATPSGEIP